MLLIRKELGYLFLVIIVHAWNIFQCYSISPWRWHFLGWLSSYKVMYRPRIISINYSQMATCMCICYVYVILLLLLRKCIDHNYIPTSPLTPRCLWPLTTIQETHLQDILWSAILAFLQHALKLIIGISEKTLIRPFHIINAFISLKYFSIKYLSEHCNESTHMFDIKHILIII